MDEPLASVVITTHNEADGIGATLASLAAQIEAPAFEIVLVDDRSTDDTVAIVKAAGVPNLRLLRNAPDPAAPLTTRQQALDLAFRESRGAVVLTLDGDTAVPARWLAEMSAPILGGRARAVAGPITFAPDNTAVARWQVADAAYYWQVAALLAPFGGGGVFFGNFAFDARLYRETGGFAAIGGALTEDLAFARAIQSRGERIAFLRGAGPVAVAPCPDVEALIGRTLRISQGPLSLLSAVLTIWPLTLLLTALLAPIGGVFPWLFAARYALGAGVVRLAIARAGARARGLNWLTYEPLAFALAAGVLPRVARGTKSDWGGRSYDR
ncbi:MAG: glycosyltransferase [Paracoccaceae bacterium]|nr:glycosyltransferase [Paracoccaceae bacterium]